MKFRLAAAALMLLVAVAPARAVVIDDATIPDTYSLDGRTLRLNGAGLRTYVVIPGYVAALYLGAPSHDPAAIMASQQAKVVVVTFRHSASKQQVEDSYRKGERINCGNGQCDKAELPDFERLVAASTAMKPGDTAAYVYEPKRIRVLINGQVVGDYADGALSKQLLLGFLGDHPPTERLKAQLLGLAAAE